MVRGLITEFGTYLIYRARRNTDGREDRNKTELSLNQARARGDRTRFGIKNQRGKVELPHKSYSRLVRQRSKVLFKHYLLR